jgi:hypothetical protein
MPPREKLSPSSGRLPSPPKSEAAGRRRRGAVVTTLLQGAPGHADELWHLSAKRRVIWVMRDRKGWPFSRDRHAAELPSSVSVNEAPADYAIGPGLTMPVPWFADRWGSGGVRTPRGERVMGWPRGRARRVVVGREWNGWPERRTSNSRTGHRPGFQTATSYPATHETAVISVREQKRPARCPSHRAGRDLCDAAIS